jgi:hypothetical protein
MKELEIIAKKRGLTVRQLGSAGHVRIEGGSCLVDYWPDSKRRTAIAVGTSDSRPHVTPQQAVEMAFLPTPVGQNLRTVTEPLGVPRKRTVREWIALLPYMKFAFTKQQREN